MDADQGFYLPKQTSTFNKLQFFLPGRKYNNPVILFTHKGALDAHEILSQSRTTVLSSHWSMVGWMVGSFMSEKTASLAGVCVCVCHRTTSVTQCIWSMS